MRARYAFAFVGVLILSSCDPIPLRDLIAQQVIGGTILYVDASATANGDGKSWSTAYHYLQDALVKANGLEDATGWAPTIYVAEGVYYPDDIDHLPAYGPVLTGFDVISHMKLYGGFPHGGGTRDPAVHKTVLSGDIDHNDVTDAAGVTVNPTDVVGTNAQSVVNCLASGDLMSPALGPETVLDGVTITASGSFGGMGISVSNSSVCSPTLTDIVFQGNIGGGLVVTTESGVASPRLERVVFRRNYGGIFDAGGMTVNTSKGGTSNPVLLKVSFQENTNGGVPGGGMSLNAGKGRIAATLVNVRFEGNNAGGGGGADCTVDAGGTNKVELVNCLFVGNSASYGGAISARGDMSVAHSGVLQLSLANASLSGNTATSAGAIYATYCGIAISNSILWSNTATPILNDTGSTTYFSTSDVALSGGSLSWNSSFGSNGGGNIDQDPLFTTSPSPGDASWTTLADNNYGNLALSGGSPAIDAGQNGVMPADAFDVDADGNTSEQIPIDLAGNPRSVGAGIDMGAFESP
jgi:predicted outer membrane repeat protein